MVRGHIQRRSVIRRSVIRPFGHSVLQSCCLIQDRSSMPNLSRIEAKDRCSERSIWPLESISLADQSIWPLESISLASFNQIWLSALPKTRPHRPVHCPTRTPSNRQKPSIGAVCVVQGCTLEGCMAGVPRVVYLGWCTGLSTGSLYRAPVPGSCIWTLYRAPVSGPCTGLLYLVPGSCIWCRARVGEAGSCR